MTSNPLDSPRFPAQEIRGSEIANSNLPGGLKGRGRL